MKKGFSLIELLAVIVILAIIALIATPIVLNIINDTKESSLLRSAEFYLNAIEQSITQLNAENGGNFNPKSCEIEESGNIICDKNKDNVITLKLDGEKPDDGVITIENGKINKVELYYKDKLITKKESKKLEYSPVIYKKVEDSNPGIICGEGTKEDLNQTTCYIKSIEDLVELSTLVNKGTTFENKKVELIYSLDFNSKRSYASKQVNEVLITGVGFTPIALQGRTFKGTFEGNENTIKGLYINRSSNAGTNGGVSLFGFIESANIQNLNIESANVVGYSGSSILVGTNKNGTIQNVSLNNTTLISDGGRTIGSLVGNNNLGIIKDIKATNINVTGTYLEVGGLVGINNSGTIENIVLDNINMKNETRGASGLVGDNKGTVKNIKATNINIVAKGGGGLIGSSSGIVQNVDIENVDIISTGNVSGGLIGNNTGELVENITLNNISITSSGNSLGGVSAGNGTGTIKNIVGNNISLNGINSVGGVSSDNRGLITQIKLNNVYVEGNDRIGGVVGSNSGIVKNSIIKANVKGNDLVGLITGINGTTSVNTVVAEGDVEGKNNIFAGLVGYQNWNKEPLLFVSCVNKKQNLITFNGEIKSLDNMGKVSQTEYEAIGFEFESTDENEAYWYFNENDELDLMIK